jgi:hypothetical protein
MDPWLKIIQALQQSGMGPGGTPNFNPNSPGPGTNVPVASGVPPLRSAIPDPARGPYAQQQVPGSVIPSAQPSNQVPTSPPTTTTGNIPDTVARGLTGQQINPAKFDFTKPYDPSQVQEVARAAIDTAKTPSERERLEKEYYSIASAPPEKQNKWLSALFAGLQATQRIADPENRAGTYQQGAPFKSLAETRKEDALTKIAGRLNPLYAQQKQKYEGITAGAKAEEALAEAELKRTQAAKLKSGAGDRIHQKGEDGKTYYSDDKGKTWKDSQGIPAPQRIKQKLKSTGDVIDVDPQKVYDQEKSTERTEITAAATRESKEIERQIAQGKMTAEQGSEYNQAVRKYETDRQALIIQGEELQNEASALEGQAADLEARGGAAEAAELRKDATAKRREGRAKIRQGNELRKPKKEEFQTYTVPKSSGKVPRSKDPLGLLN